MLPIERDPRSATAPLSPFPKTRSEAPARPPLAALEIPVTVHCVRIVEGSDKREPFSETTKTVMVYSHGALVRLSTTLVPGQRVFLLNEKTQKEAVCQVVKSAPGGSALGYIELQFSEPAADFWDIPIPVATPASVSAPSIAPADLETTPPVPPAAVKAATPRITAPGSTFVAAGSPTVTPPPQPVLEPEPATRQFLGRAANSAQSPVVPRVATAPLTPKIPPAQVGTASPPPAVPPAPVMPNPATSAPPRRDLSEEITTLSTGTNVPDSPQVSPVNAAPPPSPVSSLTSLEELMFQAARLQESLNLLQFRATPPAAPAPFAPPDTLKTEPPAAQVAKTALEFAGDEPKRVVKSEPKSFLPSHQRIDPCVSVEPVSGVSASTEESRNAFVAEAPRRWRTNESEAQVLGKSPVHPRLLRPVRKKALTLGLAASVLLVLGAGTLYLRQNHSAPPATVGALSTPSSPAPLEPPKNATRIPSRVASETLATGQPPSTPITEAPSVPAVVEPSAPPAGVEPALTPAATLDPQPVANPPAAESQPTVSAGESPTAGASDPAPESAPADVPSSMAEVADETTQPRPGVQVGGFEKPSAGLAAFDPGRHRVSIEKDEGQAFQQGQHPGCSKNVTLGSVGKEKLYLGIPEWASRWIEKNNKKLPGICFSDSPMPGAQNFLIVFYTSAASAQTEPLSTSASSSADSWPEGQGAFRTSHGSTWHYIHDETVGTTVTSLLPDDSPHSRPAHVSYAMAYTEEGLPISRRRPPTETKKPKKFSAKPDSAKPGKRHDESTGVYRELDELLSLVVPDIAKQ